MDRWRQCSLVSFICLVLVGFHQQEQLLIAFQSSSHLKNNHDGNLTWKEMLPLFSRRNSSACRTYYEFGGVINRLSSLTFLDGQKSVCLDPGVAPTPDKCVVYSFGNNGEWSFDEQIELYGCDVYVFDPSVWYNILNSNFLYILIIIKFDIFKMQGTGSAVIRKRFYFTVWVSEKRTTKGTKEVGGS